LAATPVNQSTKAPSYHHDQVFTPPFKETHAEASLTF